MPAGVLFVHNNFPAQFRDLAETLVARGVPCAAIGSATAPNIVGVRIGRYNLSRGSTPDILPLATRAEADLIRGRASYTMAKALAGEGFDPQVIIGHVGWGETVLLSEVFPRAKQLLFSEFFYHGRGFDLDFDDEFFQTTEDAILTAKAKNAVMALALTDGDAIVCPTPFQASALPSIFSQRVRIIHEGVDVEAIRPGAPAAFTLPDGRVIPPGTPVITHINNKLEPLRGLHIFARALPRLLEAVPNAQVLIMGEAQSRAYGGDAPAGQTWKDVAFHGVTVDPARVHFLGKVPREQMLAALRLSTAHVYYTYPFVLSWSLIEAMAAGCYVIGSDTAPLQDAIEDGVTGRLLPFFDVEALAAAMIAACRNPAAASAMRGAARETAVLRFSQTAGREAWLSLIREMGVSVPG